MEALDSSWVILRLALERRGSVRGLGDIFGLPWRVSRLSKLLVASTHHFGTNFVEKKQISNLKEKKRCSSFRCPRFLNISKIVEFV